MSGFKCIGIVILLWSFSSDFVYCQDDNILWSSLRYRHQVNEKFRFDVRPIMRHNQDISNYQNSSIDYAVNYKLDKGWYVQVIGRSWFIPDRPYRQFVWPEIGHVQSLSAGKLTNRIRHHWALDINDWVDPDFLRWQTNFTPKVNWKIKPFLSIEPWFRLNGANRIERMRYEPGINYKMADKLNLTVMYRRQNDIDVDPAVIRADVNMYVVTITYSAK